MALHFCFLHFFAPFSLFFPRWITSRFPPIPNCGNSRSNCVVKFFVMWYFDSADNEDARYQTRLAINAQRTKDYETGEYARQGGVIDPLPENAPYFVKDYHDYYKTPRGYHPRSLNSNDGWTVNTQTSLMNMRLFPYVKEIRSAVLMVHGDKAHSCYMSRDAYANMVEGSKYADNKELLIIPGASHTDLYDGGGKDAIPFDKIEAFFWDALK